MAFDPHNMMYVAKEYEENLKANVQKIFSSDKVRLTLDGVNETLDLELQKLDEILNSITAKSTEVDFYRRDVHRTITNEEISANELLSADVVEAKSHPSISNVKNNRSEVPYTGYNFINKEFDYDFDTVNLDGSVLSDVDNVKTFNIQLSDSEFIKVVEFSLTYRQNPDILHFSTDGTKTVEKTVETTRVFSGRFFILRADPINNPDQIVVKAIIKNSDNNGSPINEKVINIRGMNETRDTLYNDTVGPELDFYFMVPARNVLNIAIGNIVPYRWLIEKTYISENKDVGSIFNIFRGNITNKSFDKLFYSKTMNKYFIVDDTNHKFYYCDKEFDDSQMIEMPILYTTGITVTEISGLTIIQSDNGNTCIGTSSIGSFTDIGMKLTNIAALSTGEILVQEGNSRLMIFDPITSTFNEYDLLHTLLAGEVGLVGTFCEIENGTLMVSYATTNKIYYKFRYVNPITNKYSGNNIQSIENVIEVPSAESINPMNGKIKIVKLSEGTILLCNYYGNSTSITKIFSLKELNTSSVLSYSFESINEIKRLSRTTQSVSDNWIIVEQIIDTPMMTFAIDDQNKLYVIDDKFITEAVSFEEITGTREVIDEITGNPVLETYSLGFSDKNSLLRLNTDWSEDEYFSIDNPYLNTVKAVYGTPTGVYIADDKNVYEVTVEKVLKPLTFLENREVVSVSNVDYNNNRCVIAMKDTSILSNPFELYEQKTNLIIMPNERLRYKYLDLHNGFYGKYNPLETNSFWGEWDKSGIMGPIVDFKASLYISLVDRTGSLYSTYRSGMDVIRYTNIPFSEINPNEEHNIFFSKIDINVDENGNETPEDTGLTIMLHPNVVYKRLKTNKYGFIRYEGFSPKEDPNLVNSINKTQNLLIVHKNGNIQTSLPVVRNQILKIMKNSVFKKSNRFYNIRRVYEHDESQTVVNEYPIDFGDDFITPDNSFNFSSIEYWGDKPWVAMNKTVGADKVFNISAFTNSEDTNYVTNNVDIVGSHGKILSLPIGNFMILKTRGIYKFSTNKLANAFSQNIFNNTNLPSYLCAGFNSKYVYATHGEILNMYYINDAFQHVIITCEKGSFIYRCRDSDTSNFSQPLSDPNKLFWLVRRDDSAVGNVYIGGYLNDIICTKENIFFVSSLKLEWFSDPTKLAGYTPTSETVLNQPFGGMYKLAITIMPDQSITYSFDKVIEPNRFFIVPNLNSDMGGRLHDISYENKKSLYITLDWTIRSQYTSFIPNNEQTTLIKYNMNSTVVEYIDHANPTRDARYNTTSVENSETYRSKIVKSDNGEVYCGGASPLLKFDNIADSWIILNEDFSGRLYYMHNRLYSMSKYDGNIRWFDTVKNKWISIYNNSVLQRLYTTALTETPFDVFVISKYKAYKLVDSEYESVGINYNSDEIVLNQFLGLNGNKFSICDDTTDAVISYSSVKIANDFAHGVDIKSGFKEIEELDDYQLVLNTSVPPIESETYYTIKRPKMSQLTGLQIFDGNTRYFEKERNGVYERLDINFNYDPIETYYKATNVSGSYIMVEVNSSEEFESISAITPLYVEMVTWKQSSDLNPIDGKSYYIMSKYSPEYEIIPVNQAFNPSLLYFTKNVSPTIKTLSVLGKQDVHFDRKKSSFIYSLKTSTSTVKDFSFVYKYTGSDSKRFYTPFPIVKVWNLSCGDVCLYRKGANADNTGWLYGLGIFDNDYQRLLYNLLPSSFNLITEDGLIIKEVGNKIFASIYEVNSKTYLYNPLTHLFDSIDESTVTHSDFVDYYGDVYAVRKNVTNLIVDKFINETKQWEASPILNTGTKNFNLSGFGKIVDKTGKERLYIIGTGDSNLYKLIGNSFVPIRKEYNNSKSSFGDIIQYGKDKLLISGTDNIVSATNLSRNVLYLLDSEDNIKELSQHFSGTDSVYSTQEFFKLPVNQNVIEENGKKTFISNNRVRYIGNSLGNHFDVDYSPSYASNWNTEKTKIVMLENAGHKNILPIKSYDGQKLIFQSGFANLDNLGVDNDDYFVAYNQTGTEIEYPRAAFDQLVDTKYGLFGIIDHKIYLNEYSIDINNFQRCGTGTVGNYFRTILDTKSGIFYIDGKKVLQYNTKTEMFDIEISNTITNNNTITFAKELDDGIFIAALNKRLFNEPQYYKFGINIYNTGSKSFVNIMDTVVDVDLTNRYITDVSQTSRGVFVVTNNMPSTNDPLIINTQVTIEAKNRIFRIWTNNIKVVVYEECKYKTLGLLTGSSLIHPTDMSQVIEVNGKIYLTRSSTYRNVEQPGINSALNGYENWETSRWEYRLYEESVINPNTGKRTVDSSWRFESEWIKAAGTYTNDLDWNGGIDTENIIGDGSATWYNTKFGTFLVRDYHSLQYISGLRTNAIPASYPPYMSSNRVDKNATYNGLSLKFYPTYPVLNRDVDTGIMSVVDSIDTTGTKLVKLVETENNLFAIVADVKIRYGKGYKFITLYIYNTGTKQFDMLHYHALDYKYDYNQESVKAWDSGFNWDILKDTDVMEFNDVIFFKGLNNILYRIGNWKLSYITNDAESESDDESGNVLYELKMTIENKDLFNNLMEETINSNIDKFVIKEVGVINTDDLAYQTEDDKNLLVISTLRNSVTQYFMPNNYYNRGDGNLIDNQTYHPDIKEYNFPVNKMRNLIRDKYYGFQKRNLITSRYLKKDQPVIMDLMKHNTNMVLGDIEQYIKNLDNFRIDLKIYPTKAKKSVTKPLIEEFWY